MNRVILLGRMGNEPELTYTNSGMAVCKFSLATTKKWIKDGESKDKTSWHRVVAWGKLAEIISQYGKKGAQAYVEGEIDYNEWEDDGVKKYSTNIIAENVRLLSKRDSEE